jgi:molybdopterin synthase catalytic subunit
MAFLSAQPIDLPALEAQVKRPDRGAIVSFVGQVRDHHAGRVVTSLGYSAYEPMVEKLCAEIVADAEARWPVSVAMVHRVGELTIGDGAVAIVVAGGHRDEAFAACHWLIEAVKARLPIWKRERYADGSEAWVDPTAAAGTLPSRPR